MWGKQTGGVFRRRPNKPLPMTLLLPLYLLPSPPTPSATTIQISGAGRGGQPHQLEVILQGATVARKEGHLRLPDQFYQGLHFGVSAWDLWGEQVRPAVGYLAFATDLEGSEGSVWVLPDIYMTG